jgi:hypothetical protein
MFTGIATDEMYLIRAESYARQNKTDLALADLNLLLSKRFKSSQFTPITNTDAKQALKLILMERRKELMFRTLRWSDLKRLNKEPDYAQTLTRKINGVVYELKPNSIRYTLQIDGDVIQISGMQQNP